MSILEDFKKFIFRGNVLDLAVGIIFGASFNGVVSSLTKDLVTPLIGVVFHANEFTGLVFTVKGSQFLVGDFVSAVIIFVLTMTAIYFFVVLPINTIKAKNIWGVEPPAPQTKHCPQCTREIPAAAKRCPECTAKI